MLVSAFTSYHLKKARLPSLAGGEPFGSPPLPVITLRKFSSPPRRGGAGGGLKTDLKIGGHHP